MRHKLMLGLGLKVAVLALLLSGTWKGLSSYRSTMRSMDSKLAELEEVDKLRDAVKALGDVPELARPGDILVDLSNRSTEARKALESYQARLEETVRHGCDRDRGQEELDLVGALKEGFAELDKALKQAYQPTVGQEPSTTLLGLPSVNKAIVTLKVTSLDLNNAINKDLHDRIRAAKTDYKISLAIVLPTLAIGVLLMLGLLRFFYRWVLYPIRDLEQGVNRVARGDFEYRIEVHSGDEIEDLAKAYNDMTGRLRDLYCNLAQQVNERSRQLVRSEQLAGVGFLAAGVAHEINNPLAGIAFCSEALERRLTDLLQDRNISDQDREIVAKYLKMIQEEAFRCKEITQRLLEFSRGGDRRREPTDLGELVQNVLDMVQHLPNCRGKELVFNMREPLVAPVNGQEIKSVILNLVVNALDSMDEGGTLTITQHQRDGLAELVFQDTGCGMTPAILENIFEPFYTKSRTGKGTGLGLSISHRIINQHGGDIEAVSAGLNKGSTFTVRLPLKAVEQEAGTEAGIRSQESEVRDQMPQTVEPEAVLSMASHEPNGRGRKAA
jgi:signal transduction histidine kinase